MTKETETPEKPSSKLSPPSNLKRVFAFMMDFILLIFISSLLFFYIPKFHGKESEVEFDHLTGMLTEAINSPVQDQEKLEDIMINFSEFNKRMNYELIISLVFILYFLIGEVFFSGKSIGKATFCLNTSSMDPKNPVKSKQLIVKSFLKGLSCSFMLLGLVNLLFFIFNRKHLCLHDLASKTTTTSTSP